MDQHLIGNGDEERPKGDMVQGKRHEQELRIRKERIQQQQEGQVSQASKQ